MNAKPAAQARKVPTLSQPTVTTAGAAVAPVLAVTAVSTANRQTMPQVAATVDQLREGFGPVRVVYASEGGQELEQVPVPGVIAHPPHVPNKSRNGGQS